MTEQPPPPADTQWWKCSYCGARFADPFGGDVCTRNGVEYAHNLHPDPDPVPGMTTAYDTCPGCGEPVQVWADRSGGLTVNFACDNPQCRSGKEPWDVPRPATT